MRTTRASGGRSSDEHEQHEFARTLHSAQREAPDPIVRRELSIVVALRQLGDTLSPTAAERDRMRQRVMAEFSSVVHEGNSPVLPLRATQHRRWIVGQTRKRLLVASAAAACLLMSLSGMSVLLSRDALPGDALYSFKRTAESAELGLIFGDQPKALKHLEFARDRVNEIEVMANQAEAAAKAAGRNAAERTGFLRALDDFDSDAAAGARILTDLALSGKPSSLRELLSWAEQQKARLMIIRVVLPQPISVRLDNTLALLDRIIARASALKERSSCVTITSGIRDDLGLLPAKDACKPSPASGAPLAVPVPDVTAVPRIIPPNVVIPPNLLLHPPATNPASTQNGSTTRSDLSPTRNPGGVLANPSKTGDVPLRPQPWGHSLPGHNSPQPTVPLPPWILQPRLLPPH